MADWKLDLENGDLALAPPFRLAEDGGLETAVITCLFLDARADASEELPDPSSDDPGGWWGDSLSEIPEDRIGSRLWLFRRSKNTAETRSAMRDACVEALDVLRARGIAGEISVEISAHPSDPSAVQIDVIVVEPEGGEQVFRYVWDLIREEAGNAA